MVKLLRITGYQENVPTQYGPRDHVDGILFDNQFSATVGNETTKEWLPAGKIAWSQDVIGKDLYVEYGPKGRIVSCLIK